MDYTNIINNFIKTNEVKTFLQKYNATIVASSQQKKNGTIWFEIPSNAERFGIFSNGYIRRATKNGFGEWATAAYRSPGNKEWTIDLNYYLEGLEFIKGKLKKREQLEKNRATKLVKKGRKAVQMIFEPDMYIDKNYLDEPTLQSYMQFSEKRRDYLIASEGVINAMYKAVNNFVRIK